MHSFTIDLDQDEIDALTARLEYPTFVPDPAGTGPREKRKAIPNPVSPEQFIQQAIEGFVRRLIHEQIGQAAAQQAHRDAVAAYENKRKQRK